jgi:hypothetical protein
MLEKSVAHKSNRKLLERSEKVRKVELPSTKAYLSAKWRGLYTELQTKRDEDNPLLPLSTPT